MANASIDAKGLSKTYYLLGQVDKELRRDFYKEIGSTLKQRVTAAKAEMPYGSAPRVRPGRTPVVEKRRQGAPHMRSTTKLTKTNSKAFKAISAGGGGGAYRKGLFGFAAISTTGHSIILGFAQNAHSKRGQTLVQTLRERYGPAPRFLGKQFLGKANRIELYRESQRISDRYLRILNAKIEQSATTRVSA